MSTLKTNLDNIYIELNSKLIPENINYQFGLRL